jgi:L-lactate utilization protein LutB
MDQPVAHYWRIRLHTVKKALEANNFEVYLVENCHQARKIAIEEIIPRTQAKSVAWGGSMTYLATELYTILKNDEHLTVIDTFDKSVSAAESLERRRQALLADLFITGTNAVTETGQLVNLDMIGNRIAALTFGPKHVILFVGRNKIVSDLEEARKRIKNYAAPANAMRLDKKTPCTQTAACESCKSPDRICNTWAIMEKSYPKARVKVVLINEELGL